MSLITGIPIRDSIHTDFSTGISGWQGYRTELTGEFTRQGGNVSGRYGEFSKDIQEYNRKMYTLSGVWSDTGMFLTPYNAGFRYTGTGDFNKWDVYSVQFDGVDDYVRGIEDVTDLDFIHTGAALSFWINMVDFSGEQYMGSLGENPFAYKAFFVGFNNDDIWMALQGAMTKTTDASAWLAVDTWIHICMVADGGTATFYIDGVARDTLSYTPDAANNPDAGHFDIGMAELFPLFPTPFASGFMDGKIDEVAIFKSALSASDVSAIYNGGTPQSLAPYSPFAWWRMGDGPLDDGNIAGNGLIGDQMDLTIGSELVTNGTFAADSDWTKGTGWTISDGVATHAAGSSSNLDQAFTFVTGQIYKIIVDVVSISGGSGAIQARGVSTTSFLLDSVGTKTFYYMDTVGNTTLRVNMGSATTASIDNVSMKQINGYAGIMENMTASDIVADTP